MTTLAAKLEDLFVAIAFAEAGILLTPQVADPIAIRQEICHAAPRQ